ncbi:hypothetical protein DUNSADRAFT_11018 [Dunaliella salina]|uniref:Uncharacterized protein n=1 Tax=Dunaliella salina TaxID=3046 RepID=A0ABQ7GEA4_DUNSA|nr:hypothetical protein DUNSADRAFT_11018 [Dunaliella salina]|eukprot:KAF5832938.1 hypothetical protein DUNSADRAFT_11018 [Dunaliella salina]
MSAVSAAGKELLRKRGSSCESLPLHINATSEDEMPANEDGEAPNEAVRYVSNETSRRNILFGFIPAVAIFTLVVLVSMQLLNMEQQKFQRMDKTINELKAQVRAAQNELAFVRKAKAWEESDAMTDMLNRLARAERNAQQFKQETNQHRKDLEQCRRDAGQQSGAEQNSRDAAQCRMELEQLQRATLQSHKDLQQSINEGGRCKQELQQLKSASGKPS